MLNTPSDKSKKKNQKIREKYENQASQLIKNERTVQHLEIAKLTDAMISEKSCELQVHAPANKANDGSNSAVNKAIDRL